MDGGSVAAWTAEGVRVYYLILTNGNKGSSDIHADPEALTELRRGEQRDAAKILGVTDVFFLDYEDGLLVASLEVKRDIVRVIRRICPDTVLAVDPGMLYNTHQGYIQINHPDHRAAGQAALDAVFPLARDHLSFPELFADEHLAPHAVETVLLTNFERQNYFVDITATVDQKMKALRAHSSQISDARQTCEMVRDVAARTGAKFGVQFAEGFLRVDIQ
jgi:LmbE family N-acetylglucosaminyl deacetylase